MKSLETEQRAKRFSVLGQAKQIARSTAFEIPSRLPEMAAEPAHHSLYGRARSTSKSRLRCSCSRPSGQRAYQVRLAHGQSQDRLQMTLQDLYRRNTPRVCARSGWIARSHNVDVVVLHADGRIMRSLRS